MVAPFPMKRLPLPVPVLGAAPDADGSEQRGSDQVPRLKQGSKHRSFG